MSKKFKMYLVLGMLIIVVFFWGFTFTKMMSSGKGRLTIGDIIRVDDINYVVCGWINLSKYHGTPIIYNGDTATNLLEVVEANYNEEIFKLFFIDTSMVDSIVMDK